MQLPLSIRVGRLLLVFLLVALFAVPLHAAAGKPPMQPAKKSTPSKAKPVKKLSR